MYAISKGSAYSRLPFFLPDPFPIAVAGLAGALFNGVPVACGGASPNAMRMCHKFTNKTWTRVSQVSQELHKTQLVGRLYYVLSFLPKTNNFINLSPVYFLIYLETH